MGESPEQRLCKLCNSGLVEDETHFLVECALYSNTRSVIFGNILNCDEFIRKSNKDKLVFLVQTHPRKCAKFIVNAYYIRSSMLFTSMRWFSSVNTLDFHPLFCLCKVVHIYEPHVTLSIITHIFLKRSFVLTFILFIVRIYCNLRNSYDKFQLNVTVSRQLLCY